MSGENKLIKTAKGQLSSTRKALDAFADAAADIRSLCQPPAVIASTAAWPVVSRKWKLCTDKSRAGPERRTVIFALLLSSEQPSGRAGTKAAYCSETEPVVDGLHREPATVDGARMKEVGRVGEDRPEVSAARCPTWAGSEAKSSHRAAAFVITGRRHQPAAGNTTGVGGGGAIHPAGDISICPLPRGAGRGRAITSWSVFVGEILERAGVQMHAIALRQFLACLGHPWRAVDWPGANLR